MNRYEELTYDALREICARDGARVFPKVRIGDVFELRNSGVSDAHFSYALKAHFDFLVTDTDYHPLFSVEFDGPLHGSDAKKKAHDLLKNELCSHFDHGLLRINSRYLRKDYRGLDLLTYFVDAWFLEQAFATAQQNGTVPYDEPFDMTGIISNGQAGTKRFPYWLSLDVQQAIEKLHREGAVAAPAPSQYVGQDDEGNYRCLCWLTTKQGQLIQARTGMRAQQFPAVDESDLVGMLAMFDLYEQLKIALSGGETSTSAHENFFDRTLPAFRTKYKMCRVFTCGTELLERGSRRSWAR